MAAIRATTNMIVMEIFLPSLSLGSVRVFHISLPKFGGTPNLYVPWNQLQPRPVERKASARLSKVQQLLLEDEERAASTGNEAIRKITLDHVTVSFARSGGPGGQNVNKEKNRINKDGVIVISSTKTRTQKGNIEDALQK